MEILEVLIAVLMIVAIFALVVMMNMRFNSTIDTYMPFRMAVLVANRLSSAPDLTVTPAAGESAHKNILSAAKLDNYVKNYREAMPPGSALLCFHWRAAVREPETYGYWEFGHNPTSDMPDQFASAIKSLLKDAYEDISENPINIFKFAYPGTFTEAMLKELIDMAPSSYSLPMSVVADSESCASYGGTCKLLTCWPGDDLGKKDCGDLRSCCVKGSYVARTGEILPAMLDVSVWKSKSECRDEAVVRKILDEIKAASGT